MASRFFKRHDTKPNPRALFKDEQGTPIVLTGATVRYSLRLLGETTLKVDRETATITDQLMTPGEVFYQFTAGDVDTAGVYEEEWEVEYSGGLKESFPLLSQIVVIREDIDGV